MQEPRDGLPLPDDLIERILSSSTSFSSLYATILTAKLFYQVFKTHPKSILRDVAYNIAGPALPQALRLIRCRKMVSFHELCHQESWSETEEESDSDDEDRQKHETGEKAPLTPEEIHKVVKNAKLVGELEELWSFRYKDRRSRSSSKLTPTESWRFHRAMYRIMLFNLVFHAEDYNFDVEEFDPSKLERERNRQMKFISEFPTDELLQLRSVTIYLMELLKTAELGDHLEGNPTTKQITLALGPEVVLKCYRTCFLDPVDGALDLRVDEYTPITDCIFNEYLLCPISKLLERRKVQAPPEDFTHWHSISTEVNSKNDKCDRCHRSAGFDIFYRINYKQQTPRPGLLAMSRVQYSLKHHLRFNYGEARYLIKELGALHEQCEQSPGASWCSVVTDSIFDDNLLQPAFKDLTKDDVLCESCFRKFLEEHLWVWLLEYKRSSGVEKIAGMVIIAVRRHTSDRMRKG